PHACDIFCAPVSRARKLRPRVTKRAIESLLRNVTAELELLNGLIHEFNRHPLALIPERCYSPATLAKGYFSAMGIKPPQQKFKIPDKINGIASQALFAGRAECTITRTPVPVTYVDFHAQFPSLSNLLQCREILCAENLEVRDCTASAREMMERTTLQDCFRPAFWKQLRWFAKQTCLGVFCTSSAAPPFQQTMLGKWCAEVRIASRLSIFLMAVARFWKLREQPRSTRVISAGRWVDG